MLGAIVFFWRFWGWGQWRWQFNQFFMHTTCFFWCCCILRDAFKRPKYSCIWPLKQPKGTRSKTNTPNWINVWLHGLTCCKLKKIEKRFRFKWCRWMLLRKEKLWILLQPSNNQKSSLNNDLWITWRRNDLRQLFVSSCLKLNELDGF